MTRAEADPFTPASLRPGRGSRVHFVLLFVGVLVLSFATMVNFVARVRRHGIADPVLPQLCDGTAARPFVYRRLVPAFVGWTASLFGEETNRRHAAWIQSVPAAHWLYGTLTPPDEDYILRSVEKVVILLELVVSGIGMVFLARSLFPPHPVRDWIAMLLTYALPYPCYEQGYVYDFATLAGFTWALAFLARQQWFAYLALFALGVGSRETTMLLILPFVAMARESMLRPRWIALAVGQAGLAWTMYAVFQWSYRFNAGAPITPGRIDVWLTRLDEWRIFGPAALLLAYHILHSRIRPTPFLRAGFLMLPPLLVVYYYAGRPLELRVFYEFVPVLVMFLLHLVERVRDSLGSEPPVKRTSTSSL